MEHDVAGDDDGDDDHQQRADPDSSTALWNSPAAFCDFNLKHFQSKKRRGLPLTREDSGCLLLRQRDRKVSPGSDLLRIPQCAPDGQVGQISQICSSNQLEFLERGPESNARQQLGRAVPGFL